MTQVNKTLIAVTVIAAAVGAATANAQIRDAGAKTRGEYGMSMQSTSRSLGYARNYANDYRSYAQETRQNNQPISPVVAKEHANELGHNIKLTQKHLTDMRLHAANDKETLASLDSIEKHLQDANKHQGAMLEMCKGEVDAEGSMKCCEDATQALDLAIAEHDKLMKKLALKVAAKKTTAK